MVIRRLKIKNFGKIRDKDMELSPGSMYFTERMRAEKQQHIPLSVPCFTGSQTSWKSLSE